MTKLRPVGEDLVVDGPGFFVVAPVEQLAYAEAWTKNGE